MSDLLNRFRGRDLSKFAKAFGVSGTLSLLDGRAFSMTSIPREQYQGDTVAQYAVQSSDPSVWFITSDLPDGMIRGARWTDENGKSWTIRSIEPNARNGMTKANLSE